MYFISLAIFLTLQNVVTGHWFLAAWGLALAIYGIRDEIKSKRKLLNGEDTDDDGSCSGYYDTAYENSDDEYMTAIPPRRRGVAIPPRRFPRPRKPKNVLLDRYLDDCLRELSECIEKEDEWIALPLHSPEPGFVPPKRTFKRRLRRFFCCCVSAEE